MNQSSMDQGGMNQSSMDQGSMNQGSINLGSINLGGINLGGIKQDNVKQDSIYQISINQPVMNKPSMNYLVIGLGGTGGKSTRPPCKLIFSEQKHTAQSDPSVVSINFKFSREMMSQADPTRKVLGKLVKLPAESQLQITEKDLLSLLNDISKYPGIQSWIGSQAVWKEILLTIVGKALGGQKRRLGRFLFARRINEFKTKVKILVQGLQSNGDARIAFHVIAGLACGRRSGSILLKSLFVKFTKIEALGVVKSLPSRVIWEIGDCRILIGFLILSKHHATYRISKDLDERLAIGGVADSSCHAIRFYEPTGVKSAIKNLVANENVQITHASEICSMMIAKLEEKLSIARLFERLSVVDLVDSTISASEGSALAVHSNMIAESSRKILGISILSKLGERHGSDRAALRLKIHELVNQAGVFLTINPLECDNAVPGISVGFHVLVAKTIALLPKAADKEGFVKVLQDDFCASMSGDIEFIDTENQRINRTILTIKNLFPVRMVGIPPRLQEMCNERLNGSRERMEMEIFTLCSLANYASLYAQSGADLSKLAGVQRFLGLALGLIVKSPPGGLLVFNSNNSDRFDNPPVELGSFILNAMDRMDFAAVEAIISANQIALKTGCIGGFVESKIKSEVEKSKSEDGNAPDGLEYQQHIERARYSLMLNREVTS